MAGAVVITGIGAVSPVANTYAEHCDRCFLGKSGLQSDAVSFSKAYVIGRVAGDIPSVAMGIDRLWIDRVSSLALAAADEAIRSARAEKLIGGPETGLFYGSGFGGAGAIEEAYNAVMLGSGRPRPSTVPAAMVNAGAGLLSVRFKIQGPSVTYATACASSAIAVGEAYAAVRDGRIRRALVVGAEALLTNGLLAAWDSLRVLAPPADPPQASCRPFSRDRSGIVLAEGACAMVLEAEGDARQRHASIRAEIIGYSVTSDASHLVTPTLEGQYRAMAGALADARVRPALLGYINAHATGTPVGDRIEAQAIELLLGENATHIPVSSTKAVHGHLLGAAGITEIGLCVAALERQMVPPTANFRGSDEGCRLDFVPNEAREHRFALAMSNSFAFGGTNASVVLRRA